MGWLILGLLALGYIVLVMQWATRGVFDEDCKRVQLGYRCKGDKCECNNKGDD